MVKGLVFGKFYPFHVGHQALIDFALAYCDFLYVMICASDIEAIPLEVRQSWIQKTYSNQERIKIIPYQYKESELPNTSESTKEISRIWGEVFKQIIPDLNIVFTSEKYGDYLAECMDIRHVFFDAGRKKINISATEIRNNPIRNWKFLPDTVKPYFVKKVALLGTESTGKTTLAQALAAYFQTNFVSEAARDVLSDTQSCTFPDLQKITIAHANQIQQQLVRANKILFLDTDCTITKSYSRFLFKKSLEVEDQILKINEADLYFYLIPEGIPYIQDGTRLDEQARNQLNEYHLLEIQKEGICFIEISGSWAERFQKIKKICEDFFFFGKT
ncbi:MAG: AAA family ATPase [Flammeovirgaceae bacterium]|nr:AAA family ATPase [Flammeovirgaceae bacterium]